MPSFDALVHHGLRCFVGWLWPGAARAVPRAANEPQAAPPVSDSAASATAPTSPLAPPQQGDAEAVEAPPEGATGDELTRQLTRTRSATRLLHWRMMSLDAQISQGRELLAAILAKQQLQCAAAANPAAGGGAAATRTRSPPSAAPSSGASSGAPPSLGSRLAANSCIRELPALSSDSDNVFEFDVRDAAVEAGREDALSRIESHVTGTVSVTCARCRINVVSESDRVFDVKARNPSIPVQVTFAGRTHESQHVRITAARPFERSKP